MSEILTNPISRGWSSLYLAAPQIYIIIIYYYLLFSHRLNNTYLVLLSLCFSSMIACDEFNSNQLYHIHNAIMLLDQWKRWSIDILFVHYILTKYVMVLYTASDDIKCIY